MADRTQLKERLTQAADVTAPARRLDDVVRRARVLRWRRAGATALVASVVTVAFVASLSALGGLGANDRHDTADTRVGAIGFEPDDGWSMAASDPTSQEWPPTVWVTNGPFAERDVRGGHEKDGVLRLDVGPEATIEELPPRGIVITADILYASRNELPPNETFPSRALPLRLPDSHPETSWEGYTRGHSLHSIPAAVNGYWVSVTVRYGTQDPDEAMLAEAQAELARLFVEAAPATTDDIDQFGISSALPAGWHGRLFAWTGGPPTLELSTLPIERLSGDTALPNRDRLGALDVSIVLAENDIADLGFPATTLPLSIHEQDRCNCEVLDDGSHPPDGHALYHRSFEVGGRSFDLYVEFGSSPSSVAWDQANQVLATIEIAGASRAQQPAARILAVPDDWFVQKNPLPPLIEPRIVVAAGSYDFPRPALFACGVQPGLEAMPRTDVFFWILEYPVSPDAQAPADRPPWPERFSIDLPHRHSDGECAAGAEDVRDYRFWANDHVVQVQVGIGAAAGPDLIAQLEQAVSSFDA
jgi:hypothetical protein